MDPRVSLAVALAAVALVALLAHGPVLDAQAQNFDDDEFLTGNALVLNPSWDSVRRFATELFEPTTVRGYYAPLTMTSLMVDVALGGRPEDLRVFHRTNLLLHAANAMLLVWIVGRLTGHLVPAALAGLLFAAHPLGVESVAWIAERKTLLSTFFAWIALAAWLRSVEVGSRTAGWLSGIFFVAACLAKPTAIVLPALMLALDYWPLRRLDLRALIEKLPFLAVSAVFAVVTLVSHRRTVGLELASDDAAARILTAGHLVVFYLDKILRPVDLTPVYLLPEPVTLVNPVFAVSFLIALAIGVLVVVLAVRGIPAPLVGLAIFVAGLAPTLGGVRYSWVVASDKYTYLPAFGLVLLAAWLIARGWERTGRRSKTLRAAIVVGVVVVVAAEIRATRAQLAHWQTTEGLYRYMLGYTPDFALLHLNLGSQLLQGGRTQQATEHLLRAVALEPRYARAHNNLGAVYLSQGRLALAIDHFERAVEGEPGVAAMHKNLGLALQRARRFPAAQRAFERALALDAGDAQAHCGLALTHWAQGRAEAARRAREASLRLSPGCRLPTGVPIGGERPTPAP